MLYKVISSSALSATIFTLFLCLSPTDISAQVYGPVDDRFSTISQNSITSIEASGAVLWMGPGLNAFFENSGEIYVPQNADSIFTGRGRVFSLSVEDNRVFAGLGYTSTRGGEPVQAAQGYYQSQNNGNTWDFIDFPLDNRAPDSCGAASVGTPCDIEFEYGGQTYIRTRITVPELSPPFDVDFYENTLLSVNWASGLLRSTDNGQTWVRMILPPSTADELVPGNEYEWFSQTPDGETINRYDPRFDNNLLGFGLLIDESLNVWVGTAGGINISHNALTAPVEETEWNRISFDPENDDGLLANWIVSIRQQPGTQRIWMNNWRTDPQNRDQFGVVSTDDMGETFQQYLKGIKVNDIGFFDGLIFAASDNGLYISNDDGESWQRQDRVQSPNSFIRHDARYFSLSSTDNNMWIGTSDGIASTADGGNSWRIIRVDMPLTGGNIYQPDAPNVDSYAYPNPFSPRLHSELRIKFAMDSPGRATVRIFDFGMNQIKTLRVDANGTGNFETVWDGTDEHGRLAANGTYFYVIEKPGARIDGKILLLD